MVTVAVAGLSSDSVLRRRRATLKGTRSEREWDSPELTLRFQSFRLREGEEKNTKRSTSTVLKSDLQNGEDEDSPMQLIRAASSKRNLQDLAT